MRSDIDEDPPIWPDGIEIPPPPRNRKLIAKRMQQAVEWFESNAAGLDNFTVCTSSGNKVQAHFGTLTRGTPEELELRRLFRGCSARKETKTGGAETFTVFAIIPGVSFGWRVHGQRGESVMRDEVVKL